MLAAAPAAASALLDVRTWGDVQSMFEVTVIHQDLPDEESSCKIAETISKRFLLFSAQYPSGCCLCAAAAQCCCS
jgi:hypothetical protein